MFCAEAMDKTKSLEVEEEGEAAAEGEVAMEVVLAGEQMLPRS